MNKKTVVPAGSVSCFNCDGTGTAYAPSKQTCGICSGKGHYSADDLDRWHASDPKFCRAFCGRKHVRRTGKALVVTWDEVFDAIIKLGRDERRTARRWARRWQETLRRADELLAKYEKK